MEVTCRLLRDLPSPCADKKPRSTWDIGVSMHILKCSELFSFETKISMMIIFLVTGISMMMSLRTYNCRQGDDALSDGRQYGPAAVLPQVKRSKITKMRS